MQTGAKPRRTGVRLAAWAAGTGLVLLIPLAAMQYTDEVVWTAFDFAFAGGLIFGTGALYELAARASGLLAYRAGVGVALAAAFLLIWFNGAVGIIGDEDNPANLLFGAVLAVALLGALVAAFRPDGMARALVLTALAQAAVPFMALGAFPEAGEAISRREVPVLTVFFTGLWLLSAWLFRKAGRAPGAA